MDFARHIITIILGLTSFVFIPCGLWLWKRPPKYPNMWMGYRTPRSMKSQAAWDFAQVYACRLLFYCGLALLVIALLCLPVTATEGFIVLLPTLLVLVFTALPLYLTERKLKGKFDNHR
jgi:uncharacterized membrane protein